jgi:phosphoglycolate phosphatase
VPPFAGVSTVVFDFDGTLAHLTIDFDHMRREVLALLRGYGAPVAGLERMPALELIEAAAARVAAAGRDAAAFRLAGMRAIEAVELDAAGAGGVLPGIPAALDLLRARGYRLGIVTRNCEAAVARVLQGPRGARLPHEVLLTREHVTRVKPDPAHLAAALDALGAVPGEAAMVGDHPMDVEAGRRAGMRTVGVLSGGKAREAFEAAQADLVLDDVAQLPGRLPARAPGR